jgi:hypothetical protein
MQTKEILVVYRPITSLNPAEYNPRQHTNVQAKQLASSISRYGFIDPIIVNSAPKRKNVVIGGHFRLEVAKLLNYKEVPVVYVSLPDLEKEKELNLRLNKNTGEFDIEKLKALDLDLLLEVGFEEAELTDVWSEALETKDSAFDQEAELKKIKEVQTKPGDIIHLGQHKLICGDSTKPATLKKLLGKEKASMIMSDPIYNIAIDYDKGIGGRQNYGGTVNDSKSVEEYVTFLRQSLAAALAATNDNAHVFYWCD